MKIPIVRFIDSPDEDMMILIKEKFKFLIETNECSVFRQGAHYQGGIEGYNYFIDISNNVYMHIETRFNNPGQNCKIIISEHAGTYLTPSKSRISIEIETTFDELDSIELQSWLKETIKFYNDYFSEDIIK